MTTTLKSAELLALAEEYEAGSNAIDDVRRPMIINALRLAAKPAEDGMREALEFYADANNYRSGDTYVNGMSRPVMQDGGSKARAALSTTEAPKR